MVVEENRTSSNSTGSDTRISSNSNGGSNSKTHVTEMELGIVSSQNKQTAECDKNAEGGLGGDSPSFLDTGQNTNTDSASHIGPDTSHETESIVSKEEKTDVEQVDKAHETSVCDKSICNVVTVYERNKCAQNIEALSQEQTTHCQTEIQAPLESLSNQVSDNSGNTCNELQNNPAGSDLEGHVENVVVIDNSEPAKNEKDELLEAGIGAYSKDDLCAEEDNDPFQDILDEECYEGISEHIPKCYWKTPLKCFSYNTVTLIGYRLDALEEAHDGFLAKDFTGLCDRINLDPAFTRYLVKSQIKGKTEEILSKWEVLPVGTGPRPTVGNFSKIVYYDLDRPDVIEDLHQNIVRDAEKWEATKKEAKTDKPDDEDNSWQLTRHDVATGKKTFYTACLCYADEDEGMATLITNFFQTVWKDTRFFRPQFDLKMGRYVCDTTAKVIEERCNGKVIFILSDYFYASQVCQFAVNFSHQVDAAAEQGNLIPFYLTNQYDKAPKVLKGIAGVRWARSQFRYHSWGQLTDCLISKEDNSNQSEVSEIQDRIKVELEHHSSSWLCDPPYDKDTPKPGPALPLNEPLSDSVNSSSCFDPDGDDNSPIVDSNKSSSDSAPFYRRLFHRIRKVLPGTRRKMRSRPIRAEDLNRAFREESGPSGVI